MSYAMKTILAREIPSSEFVRSLLVSCPETLI
jgi:hypothetical protein